MGPIDPSPWWYVGAIVEGIQSQFKGSKAKPSILTIKTYLAVLSSAEFVASCHLQSETGTNLNLCGQQLGTIPVVLQLLLNLLPHSQLLSILLLLGKTLLGVHSNSLAIGRDLCSWFNSLGLCGLSCL